MSLSDQCNALIDRKQHRHDSRGYLHKILVILEQVQAHPFIIYLPYQDPALTCGALFPLFHISFHIRLYRNIDQRKTQRQTH